MKTKMILLAASLVLASPALASVTAISGGVAAEAYAKSGSVESFGPASAAGWTTLQPGHGYSAASSATANFPGGLAGNPSSAHAHMAVNATWSSATSGTVNFDWGHLVQRGGLANAGKADPEWYYQFALATPAKLSLDWAGMTTLTAGISSFGLNNFIMYVDDGSEIPLQLWTGGGVDGPSGTGVSTAMLAPGSYMLSLRNPHWLNTASTIGAEGDLSIRWSINPLAAAVPEPQSWALLIAGFGLVGAAARRQRGVVAA